MFDKHLCTENLKISLPPVRPVGCYAVFSRFWCVDICSSVHLELHAKSDPEEMKKLKQLGIGLPIQFEEESRTVATQNCSEL